VETTVADAPLVARAAELERILTVVETACRGRGRLVFLDGEPGVGKTRLAREVLQHARTADAHVISGRCFEQYRDVPFFPFAEPFDNALAKAPPELQSVAAQRWPELAYLIPELGTQSRLEGYDSQLRVFRAASGFLLALAESQPIVWLLDDLHWADATSLGLVLHLARHIQDARILMLGTYRDIELGRHHQLETTLREAVRERLVEEVHLRRLTLDGTAALLRARVGVESVADDLVALVHGRAQGNPFFTEELVAAFVEQGAVSVAQGRLQATGRGEIEMPQSIRSVVGERVGRLPVEAQELLRLASVIGPEFDLEVLLAASGQPEAEVLDTVDAWLDARLLEERQASGGRERYGFRHALIHLTLYEELPPHRRRRLHLRVAAALESLRPLPATASADLARHFLLGGNTAQAARYAVQAAEQAAARYAHAEALHHYAVAFDLLTDEVGDGERAAGVQYRLASELFDLNRLPEARAAYESALATFERLGDHMGQALVHWGLGRLNHGSYNISEAVVHLDKALGLWPSADREADLVRLLADAARAAVHSGNNAHAISLSERALGLAEHVGNPGLLAIALTTRVSEDARPRLRIASLDRAEGLARNASDWRTLARVYMNRAAFREFAGDLEGNVADRLRALEAADKAGETERVAFAHQSLAKAYLMLGEWEAGRSAARTGLALDPDKRLNGAPVRALLDWMEGRFDKALHELRTFADGARRRGDAQGLTIGLGDLAEFALQVDRPADAEAAAREAVDVARNGLPPALSLTLGPLAETLVILGAPEAEANLAESLRIVHEFELYFAQSALLRARGVLLMRQDRFAEALESLQASAAVARSQHASVELGRTLAVAAVLARQRGDMALAEHADAERTAVVERIGAEVRGLKWAHGLPIAPHEPPKEADAARRSSVGRLSPREHEVARLIVGGLSNRQIAATLVISERTAENHVSSILRKLGLDTRAQVAVWAVQHGVGTASNSS
jgi:DNA-binding NarL/FixJ family response regulator